MPLWVCVGFVLALLVAGSEATEASGAHVEDALALASSTDHASVDGYPSDDSTALRHRTHERGAMHELASEPEDDEDPFEPLSAAHGTPVLVACAELIEPPPCILAVDTGRRLVSTGLGRGPPR